MYERRKKQNEHVDWDGHRTNHPSGRGKTLAASHIYTESFAHERLEWIPVGKKRTSCRTVRATPPWQRRQSSPDRLTKTQPQTAVLSEPHLRHSLSFRRRRGIQRIISRQAGFTRSSASRAEQLPSERASGWQRFCLTGQCPGRRKRKIDHGHQRWWW